eukprot:4714047-Pyramimonas_sp.AAC.1
MAVAPPLARWWWWCVVAPLGGVYYIYTTMLSTRTAHLWVPFLMLVLYTNKDQGLKPKNYWYKSQGTRKHHIPGVGTNHRGLAAVSASPVCVPVSAVRAPASAPAPVAPSLVCAPAPHVCAPASASLPPSHTLAFDVPGADWFQPLEYAL